MSYQYAGRVLFLMNDLETPALKTLINACIAVCEDNHELLILRELKSIVHAGECAKTFADNGELETAYSVMEEMKVKMRRSMDLYWSN